MTGSAGSSSRDLRGTEQCGQPHPQDHDAHTVTAAVSPVPGAARRGRA